MNPFRWIADWMMMCWIEGRATRRKNRDKQLIRDLIGVVATTECSAEPMWTHFPQCLRFSAQKKLRELFEDWKQCPTKDLPNIIKNLRICGIPITEDEERRCYEEAMGKASGKNRIFFATKLYGDPLPFDVVLKLLDETSWRSGSWCSQDNNEKALDDLLSLLDEEDVVQRDTFLRHLAKRGLYEQLTYMVSTLEDGPSDDLYESLLRECFTAQLNGKRWAYNELTSMCLMLEDWDTARNLIERWKGRKNGKKWAAELALAVFCAERMEADAITQP